MVRGGARKGAGRPPRGGVAATERLQIRATPALVAAIKGDAAARGLDVAQYVRASLCGHLGRDPDIDATPDATRIADRVWLVPGADMNTFPLVIVTSTNGPGTPWVARICAGADWLDGGSADTEAGAVRNALDEFDAAKSSRSHRRAP